MNETRPVSDHCKVVSNWGTLFSPPITNNCSFADGDILSRLWQHCFMSDCWLSKGYSQSSVKLPVNQLLTRSLGLLVTWSLNHSVTWSLGHLVTRSQSTKSYDHYFQHAHGLTDWLKHNIRTYRSASQTKIWYVWCWVVKHLVNYL